MNKYQEALDELEANAVQWKANKKWNKENGFFIDDVGIEEMVAYSKLLQELVDKEIELQSRKEKLVVCSQWECVANCYGEHWKYHKTNKVVITKIYNLYGNYINVRCGQLDDNIPEQQFLLCFKPKGGKND